MGDKFVNVLMPEALADSLQKIANEYGISRSAIVRIACSQFLKGKRIVGVSELPGPEDHVAVPVILVDEVIPSLQGEPVSSDEVHPHALANVFRSSSPRPDSLPWEESDGE